MITKRKKLQVVVMPTERTPKMKPTPRCRGDTASHSIVFLFTAFVALLTCSKLIFENVQAQQQAAPMPISGIQQAMAQMLQVFNGNDSHANQQQQQHDTNHFKMLEMVHGDWLLVGGRNVVYNLSLSSMREQRRLEWPSNDDDVRLCQVKGKSRDQCQNYIRVLKLQAPDTLLVCGTNAYKPRCRTYLITTNAYELLSEEPGEGACPYQENQNVTSTFADGELYSATAAQFSGIDGLIHRRPLRTEQFNPKQLNSPNFVSSFRYREHVYFLFREIAIEHINCGKTIYSRIARVCINDLGGSTRSNRERWTSFTKTRLNCSIPGDFPFYFDEIQASTGVVSSAYQQAAPLSSSYLNSASANSQAQQQQPQDLVYAVFTTPLNSIGGSAVCAYRMRDIEAAFEGPFKSQLDGSNSNWLPVPEGRVPTPRPGTCTNDSKRLPDETINFLKDNPLMDQAVEPVWSQPLITMASINFRFTQIVVDAQVAPQQSSSSSAMRTDVIFVSTDDGRIFKLINTYHLYAAAAAAAAASGKPAQLVQQQQQLQLQNSANYLPFAGNSFSQYFAPSASSMNNNNNNNRPMAAPLTMQQSQAAGSASQAGKSEQIADVSGSTLVIEELHLFDSRTPIVNLMLYYPTAGQSAANEQPKLIVVSSKQLKAIPLSRCERALSCADCLALYDPYCAWDLRQQACLSSGRSLTPPNQQTPFDQQQQYGNSQRYQLNVNGLPSYSRLTSQQPQLQPPNWFPPNSPISSVTPNNYTLAWWLTCPSEQAPQQVGAPFRSLFASHLQVPSRFDYQSGHHLAHTSLLSLGPSQPQQQQTSQQQRQPVSECLTFCGGVYSASSASSSSALVQQHDQTQTISQLQCADLVQQATSHYLNSGANSFLNSAPVSTNQFASQQQQQQQQQMQMQQNNLYSSENVYLAVIACAVLGLFLGLLFGFAMGKNSRKRDPSICSSTFDETNLYMASTGSHHAGVGQQIFAAQQQHQAAARLHHQHSLMSNGGGGGGGGYLMGGGNGIRPANGPGGGGPFDASQCLLGPGGDMTSISPPSVYGNQQMLLALASGANNNNGGPANHQLTSERRLPPIPSNANSNPQQQPLVDTSSQHIIHHSQLTPPDSTGGGGGQSGTSTSTTTTMTAAEQHNQLYLNQQQLLNAQPAPLSNGANLGKPLIGNQHHHHQRSFTNNSIKSVNSAASKLSAGGGGKLNGNSNATANSFQQQQQQQLQLQAQQQLNNKIYL